jgi:hypothetical protein
MHKFLPALLAATLLSAGFCALPLPAHAQVGTRAYAPEDLRTLSVADQRRVISLEYSEQSNGRRIPDDQLRFYLDQVRLSRWTFSRIKQDIAKSLAGSAPRPPSDTGSIRCESKDGRQRVCNTPWAGRSTLRRQLSDTRCVQNETWFSAAGRVTVTRGCRGEFGPVAGLPGPGAGLVSVRCESVDGRFKTCGNDLVGRVQLQRQLSSIRCVEDSNYGLRNGSIWVNGGCRGLFQARSRPGNGGPGHGGPGNSTYTVTCSSLQGHRATCAWDGRRGVPRMLQQLSDQACTQGRSWGYSARTGLWVDQGCRARFGAR